MVQLFDKEITSHKKFNFYTLKIFKKLETSTVRFLLLMNHFICLNQIISLKR